MDTQPEIIEMLLRKSSDIKMVDLDQINSDDKMEVSENIVAQTVKSIECDKLSPIDSNGMMIDQIIRFPKSQPLFYSDSEEDFEEGQVENRKITTAVETNVNEQISMSPNTENLRSNGCFLDVQNDEILAFNKSTQIKTGSLKNIEIKIKRTKGQILDKQLMVPSPQIALKIRSTSVSSDASPSINNKEDSAKASLSNTCCNLTQPLREKEFINTILKTKTIDEIIDMTIEQNKRIDNLLLDLVDIK